MSFAAKKDDQVVGVDIHIVMVPSPGGPVPTPLPHPFMGMLDGGLVATVTIGGADVAVKDSTATNQPSHIAMPPGTSFQSPPADSATITMASATVTAGGSGIARMGDTAETCGDPDAPVGSVIAAGTVMVGG